MNNFVVTTPSRGATGKRWRYTTGETNRAITGNPTTVAVEREGLVQIQKQAGWLNWIEVQLDPTDADDPFEMFVFLYDCRVVLSPGETLFSKFPITTLIKLSPVIDVPGGVWYWEPPIEQEDIVTSMYRDENDCQRQAQSVVRKGYGYDNGLLLILSTSCTTISPPTKNLAWVTAWGWNQ